nr:fimbrial chaperone [uncultured Enterobacter sp.]
MRSHSLKNHLLAAVTSIISLMAFSAHADIVISGTRIIYPQSAKDVTVKLENRGNKPLLVQSWLDDGRDTTNPQELKLPFIVTPPVSRVDPGKGQTVRVTWLGQPLAQDRESLFWFNVLEVPPKTKGTDEQNVLQLAFRTRIKLFFRPDGLKSDPATAAGQLSWSSRQQQGQTVLIAQNSTPYYVSVAKVEATAGSKTTDVEPHYVAPFSRQEMPVSPAITSAVSHVKFITINDFGGADSHDASVN